MEERKLSCAGDNYIHLAGTGLNLFLNDVSSGKVLIDFILTKVCLRIREAYDIEMDQKILPSCPSLK